MAKNVEKAEAPPYVAFRTLWNFLDRLGQIGTPPRIDRSVWGDQMSGAYGSQLMAALRFLDLIDESGNADTELKTMADDLELRREILHTRINRAYRPAIGDLDLAEATMAQLQEKFKDTYSVTGETFNKAISFFTHAAQTAGIKLSPYIERSMKKRTATGRPKPKRKAKTGKASLEKPKTGSNGHVPQPPSEDAHERIVTLRSGGTVKLSLDYNAFKLSNEDRSFVFGLIDMVQKYESGGEALQ